jgi:hypothetical protein
VLPAGTIGAGLQPSTTGTQEHMPPRGVKKATSSRPYEHIRQSELNSGQSGARAEEIAARTVNREGGKERRGRAELDPLGHEHVFRPARWLASRIGPCKEADV